MFTCCPHHDSAPFGDDNLPKLVRMSREKNDKFIVDEEIPKITPLFPPERGIGVFVIVCDECELSNSDRSARNYLFLRAAWAAANRAMGTRKGEQLT